MTAGYLVTLVGTALTVIIGGWFTLRQARATSRTSPYDALAGRVVRLETSDDEKRAQIEKLEHELAIEKEHSRTQDGRIRALRAGISDWQSWYSALLTGWPIFSQQQAPPPAPGPVNLPHDDEQDA